MQATAADAAATTLLESRTHRDRPQRLITYEPQTVLPATAPDLPSGDIGELKRDEQTVAHARITFSERRKR
jgi:hypothetical protein